jgi:hypothetical protein
LVSGLFEQRGYGSVKRLLRPLIRVAKPLMRAFAGVVSWCFLPFTAIAALFKKS